MAVDAGKVAVNPRGVFSSSATYERLDVVTYQSNTYVALQTTQGNLPTDTSSWAPWVKLDNASMTVRGLVKVDGTSITADADGTIHGHAAAGVNSFNGREGDVLPELGDYDANQIAYDNSNSGLASTDVNDAIDELAAKTFFIDRTSTPLSFSTVGNTVQATVSDARVTANSFCYVCFTDACIQAAANANVVVDSASGSIVFTADSTPSADLYCLIEVTNQ